jgi:hypothetical protein
MEDFNLSTSQIIDVIYKKPEFVVRLLQNSGYSIDLNTATLQKINELTFKALANNDIVFANGLLDIIKNTN